MVYKVSPGYQFLGTLLDMRIENYCQYIHQFNKHVDIFFNNEIDKYCPKDKEELVKYDDLKIIKNKEESLKEKEKNPP